MAYNNYQNYGSAGWNNGGFNNVNQNGMGQNTDWRNNWSTGNNGWNGGNSWGQQPMQNQMPKDREYVTGRAGADAYPLKPGENMKILWDTEAPRFYIKGYDSNGLPRILEDNDYTPHVDPEPKSVQQIDMSGYAKIDDIRNIVSEAISGLQIPNMAAYVTQAQLDQVLNKFADGLAVGAQGKIVRAGDTSNG